MRLDDRGNIATSSDYHKILFDSSYYNTYSLLRAMGMMQRLYRKRNKRDDIFTTEELAFLNEPVGTISLYEFFYNENSSLTVDKFIPRLVKLISNIHYLHESGVGDEVQYISHRFRNPLDSTNGLLSALLKATY